VLRTVFLPDHESGRNECTVGTKMDNGLYQWQVNELQYMIARRNNQIYLNMLKKTKLPNWLSLFRRVRSSVVVRSRRSYGVFLQNAVHGGDGSKSVKICYKN